jgi:NAD(P)-dependent dehydrogenase (short-subunit alcohol dehydrogenase family)
LVTGSTGGLGAAFATALAEQGAFVVVSGRDKARGRAVLERIASTGGAAALVTADLGQGAQEVRVLADEATTAAGGRIDVLVNNAAMLVAPAPTAEVPEQLVADAFAVNVTAPFLLTGIIAPAMAHRGYGSIVNIGPSLTERNADIAEHLAPLLARIPSRRASTLSEVAAAVVFLASDDASGINGATLSVDGGWSAV